MFVAGYNRWRQQHQSRRHERRIQQLQKRSQSHKGKGWLIDPQFPNAIFVLGYHLRLDKTHSGYTLEYLQAQYVALKQELFRLYPNFEPFNTLLEVEAYAADQLLLDQNLLPKFSPVVRSFRSLHTGQITETRVNYLETSLTIDGDQVTLRISSASYYEGYGFFVYNHPNQRVGMWCRPNPDILAQVAGEQTM